MARAIRGQYDGKEDDFSDNAVIDYTNDPEAKSETRQEFKDEADINNILKKFGVDAFTHDSRFFVETNYHLDLQQLIGAAADVQEAHAKLPDDLRQLFPSVEAMLAAARNGDLRTALDQRAEQDATRTREAELEKALTIEDAKDARAAKRRADRAAKRAELDDDKAS